MARSHLETARLLLDMGPGELESTLALCHRDIEVFPLRSAIEGPYTGHTGVRQWTEDTADFEIEMRVDDMHELGERVVVLGIQWMRARESELRVELPLALVIDFEAELVRALHAYPTHEEALRAAGRAWILVRSRRNAIESRHRRAPRSEPGGPLERRRRGGNACRWTGATEMRLAAGKRRGAEMRLGLTATARPSAQCDLNHNRQLGGGFG